MASEAGQTPQYRCDSCGWVYEPAEHDNRPLADHDDWECPECQSGMDHFDVVLPEELGEPEEDDPEDKTEPAALGIPMSQRKVSAHKADNSVFELSHLEQTGQLVLQPTFQRYYVWTPRQASALVESLFLQLPIPLIYLAEEHGGEYAVVDGQQRLTALITYTRNLYALTGLTVLTDLNGKRFSELTKPQQRHLENYLLSIIRIDKDSHPEVKFEVFERLNTGSVKLNDQEVRNAVYRGPYNDHLRKLARNKDFMSLLGQDEPHRRMSDVELVLRFAAWTNQGYLALTTKQLKAFMNAEMERGDHTQLLSCGNLRQSSRSAWNLRRRSSVGEATGGSLPDTRMSRTDNGRCASQTRRSMTWSCSASHVTRRTKWCDTRTPSSKHWSTSWRRTRAS